MECIHCVKSVHIWIFPGPCFPAFELDMEIYAEYGHFLRSDISDETTHNLKGKEFLRDTFSDSFQSSHLKKI